MIYCTHGIVKNFNSFVFTHKNMLDWDATENYLKTRKHKFKSLELALSGEAEALTIDDNTQAAYDLAEMAIRHGHEVTLFVNPYNLAHDKDYSFALLNLLIDSLPESILEFDGKDFDCTNFAGKKRLRTTLKKVLTNPKSENERTNAVMELANHWGINLDSIPAHLTALSTREIRALLDMGVRIENHGWEHISINDWEIEEVEHFVNHSYQWLMDNLDIHATIFAVPFGEVLPISPQLNLTSKYWLLQDSALKLGSIENSVYNRETLQIIN